MSVGRATPKMIVEKLILTSFLFSVGFCQFDPHFFGNRSAFVHLFEWKWQDIADECERFLQHKGYGGVQISPPNENLVIEKRPWWERYQPVSYKLETRSGDENDFKAMTRRCNNVGVRIYVDAVINHMSASDGIGTAGSKADYNNKYYPGVPYTKGDFHDSCTVSNYQDIRNVRNCQLVGLSDLDHSKEHVRQKISEYMNHLIDLGVAGFRIDAAKHMWPGDLKKIVDNLKNLNTDYGFQPDSRPFVFQEVIDPGNERVIQDYVQIGAVTEFKHSNSISNVFQGNDKLVYLESWGPRWDFLSNGVPVVFVDNHDTQRDEGKLTYKKSKQYKMANAFMLAHPYGIPKVMSSFDFQQRDQGPPQDSSGNLISPQINPDDTCSNGYICEQRWRQIYSMVEFRMVVKGTPVTNWWSNGDQQIAFCRGNRGFVAFTNWGDLKQRLQTCLPPGTYCDVISGAVSKGSCTGKRIQVSEDGMADVSLGSYEYDGVLAIHINSKL